MSSIQVRHRPMSPLVRQRKRKELEAELQRAIIAAQTGDREARDTIQTTLEDIARLYASDPRRGAA